MTGPGRICLNGHPTALSEQRFCEVCGAPFGASVPMPPPMAPMPPAGPPPGWVPPPPVAGPPPGAWSPQGAPPAGWSPQGAAPTWQGAAGVPQKQRGCAPVILLLLVLLALAAGAAYVVLARPFGPAPSASPGPGGILSPTVRPTLVASPTPTASAVASGAAPTPAPTPPTETAAATPSTTNPAPSDGETATCRSETARITVTYPAGWQAYAGDPQWTCLLFDPNPITVLPDTELPQVAVGIYPDTRTYAAVQADFTTTTVYTQLGTESGAVDGHNAIAYEVENTGQGFYEKGVLQTVVIVDLADRGTLVLETVGVAGAEYDANVAVLGGMIRALLIDP
jgi:hypothetical protein